jgi:hypothetical protein
VRKWATGRSLLEILAEVPSARISRSKSAAPLHLCPWKSRVSRVPTVGLRLRGFSLPPPLRGGRPPQPQDVHLNRG